MHKLKIIIRTKNLYFHIAHEKLMGDSDREKSRNALGTKKPRGYYPTYRLWFLWNMGELKLLLKGEWVLQLLIIVKKEGKILEWN